MREPRPVQSSLLPRQYRSHTWRGVGSPLAGNDLPKEIACETVLVCSSVRDLSKSGVGIRSGSRKGSPPTHHVSFS